MLKRYPCLIAAVHMHGHDDGCRAILDHLATKYVFAARDGKRLLPKLSGRIARDWRDRIRETLVIEAPYPTTAGALVEKLGIPPHKVTHVLGLIDARTLHEDPHGFAFANFEAINGVTAIGLGNVWMLDPEIEGVTSFEKLNDTALAFIAYVEHYLSKPVPYVATSPTTIVDREGVPAHDVEDSSTTVTIGTSDAA